MERLPKEPTPENIDSDIEKLLEALESYGELYNKISLELQDRWYEVEMEGRVAKDRRAAKTHLEEFINILDKIKRGKS